LSLQNYYSKKMLRLKFWNKFYLDDRKSSGFSRGVSKYRGVARYHIFLEKILQFLHK
jgi:hypothetical protein